MAIDTTQHEQIVREYAAWVNGDSSKADVVAESVDVYNPGMPDGEVHSRADWGAYLRKLRSGFPDLQFTEEEVASADDVVMVEFVLTGTHRGEFRGLPPTGREVTIRGVDRFLVEDGTIQEIRVYFDSQRIPEQLGLTFPTIVTQLPKLGWRKIQQKA